MERPEPFFIAGSVGLDFLNSIATPVDAPVEWLTCGEDLVEWLLAAKLLTSEAANAVRESALPGELDAVAAQARALREWFRGFVRAHMGKRLDRNAIMDLEPLNQLLARDHEYLQIVARNAGKARAEEDVASPLLYVRQRPRWSPDALLLVIAKALADIVCKEDFVTIKACEGSVCTLLYFDRTRAHARRWCSMAVCGNRWKQAAHRVRRSAKPLSTRLTKNKKTRR